MPALTIAEASARLGVSPDTIRRRISRGELPARKEKGKYLVEITPAPDPPVATAPAGPAAGTEVAASGTPAMSMVQGDETGDLRRTISILETELTARTREIHELHILLQQAQTATLPAGWRQDRRPWWRRIFQK